MPTFSIITVNLNNAAGLQATLNSVRIQSFRDYEHIIIDGGSTDSSIAEIRSYEGLFNGATGGLHWCSQKDNGVYEAMNRGVQQAKGHYLLMLNSGDVLHRPDSLLQVVNAGLEADIIYGDVEWVTSEGNYIHHFPDRLPFSYFFHNSLGHQAAFIRREVHDLVGLYCEEYKIVSDWSFFVTALCKHNVSYQHIPVVVADCPRDGISTDQSNYPIIDAEKEHFLNLTFPAFLDDYQSIKKFRLKKDGKKPLWRLAQWLLLKTRQ